MEDGDHKIIIFSEWERMLELVREQSRRKWGWATPCIPARSRSRNAATRSDASRTIPRCRLFLSTDSGATGLNLQVADVVINLDMPWNPAKLEQRIARAWRKAPEAHRCR